MNSRAEIDRIFATNPEFGLIQYALVQQLLLVYPRTLKVYLGNNAVSARIGPAEPTCIYVYLHLYTDHRQLRVLGFEAGRSAAYDFEYGDPQLWPQLVQLLQRYGIEREQPQ